MAEDRPTVPYPKMLYLPEQRIVHSEEEEKEVLASKGLSPEEPLPEEEESPEEKPKKSKGKSKE